MRRKVLGWVLNASGAKSQTSTQPFEAHTSRFSDTAGNLENLSKIKYVITLDTDTQLPRDSARKLVEAMAHPLNRPKMDPKK